MSGKATWVKLEDIADITSGGTPSKARKDYWTGDIPWVSAKDMKTPRLLEAEDYISEEGLKSGSRIAPKGATLILARGMTLVSDVPTCLAGRDLAFNQDLKALVAKKGINNSYLYYAVLASKPTLLGAVELAGHGTGRLPTDRIKSLSVRLPSEWEQKRIANILRTLDDKIALNRQINQTLEAMAQALFKSWFVDFEPVRVKLAALETGEDPTRAAMRAISGKTDEALDTLQTTDPNTYAQLETTASLFPDALVESELSLVPEGWEIGMIGDIAKAKGGYAFKSSEFTDEGFQVIKIKNINDGGTVDITDCDYISFESAKKANKFIIESGRLLMAMTGATVGKSGLFISEKPAYLNQRVAFFESTSAKVRIDNFLFCLFKIGSVYEQVIGNAQGSAQPNISSNGIESVKILVPDFKMIKRFILTVESLFEQRSQRIIENRTLATLRDTLLPKLLSGELSVTEIEEAVPV